MIVAIDSPLANATAAPRPVTLQRHLAEQQKTNAAATGSFTALLWEFVLAVKMIAREVRRAGLIDILGATGRENHHGERVQKLDEYAQDLLETALGRTGLLCAMASEERSDLIPIPAGVRRGRYAFLFDPLDGSGNIDVNLSIGTIFSIHRRVTREGDGTLEDCLQAGYRQVAAGYVLYGSSVMLVYTTGKGVHGFTLDPSVGEFLLSHPDIRIPSSGRTYSVNEANAPSWDPGIARYVDWLKKSDIETRRPYSSRYVGSMVADVHRTLMTGGIFMYPGSPQPKLRLLYEAAPMAMVIEQAGGRAVTGKERILDVRPRGLHERVPVILGSPGDVERCEQFLQG
jgi:fructose-1,6-bisphosphatase I